MSVALLTRFAILITFTIVCIGMTTPALADCHTPEIPCTDGGTIVITPDEPMIDMTTTTPSPHIKGKTTPGEGEECSCSQMNLTMTPRCKVICSNIFGKDAPPPKDPPPDDFDVCKQCERSGVSAEYCNSAYRHLDPQCDYEDGRDYQPHERIEKILREQNRAAQGDNKAPKGNVRPPAGGD